MRIVLCLWIGCSRTLVAAAAKKPLLKPVDDFTWVVECALGSTKRTIQAYAGASHVKALYVSKIILKSILCFTGSQCRSTRTGLMWSDLPNIKLLQ